MTMNLFLNPSEEFVSSTNNMSSFAFFPDTKEFFLESPNNSENYSLCLRLLNISEDEKYYSFYPEEFFNLFQFILSVPESLTLSEEKLNNIASFNVSNVFSIETQNNNTFLNFSCLYNHVEHNVFDNIFQDDLDREVSAFIVKNPFKGNISVNLLTMPLKNLQKEDHYFLPVSIPLFNKKTSEIENLLVLLLVSTKNNISWERYHTSSSIKNIFKHMTSKGKVLDFIANTEQENKANDWLIQRNLGDTSPYVKNLGPRNIKTDNQKCKILLYQKALDKLPSKKEYINLETQINKLTSDNNNIRKAIENVKTTIESKLSSIETTLANIKAQKARLITYQQELDRIDRSPLEKENKIHLVDAIIAKNKIKLLELSETIEKELKEFQFSESNSDSPINMWDNLGFAILDIQLINKTTRVLIQVNANNKIPDLSQLDNTYISYLKLATYKPSVIIGGSYPVLGGPYEIVVECNQSGNCTLKVRLLDIRSYYGYTNSPVSNIKLHPHTSAVSPYDFDRLLNAQAMACTGELQPILYSYMFNTPDLDLVLYGIKSWLESVNPRDTYGASYTTFPKATDNKYPIFDIRDPLPSDNLYYPIQFAVFNNQIFIHGIFKVNTTMDKLTLSFEIKNEEKWSDKITLNTLGKKLDTSNISNLKTILKTLPANQDFNWLVSVKNTVLLDKETVSSNSHTKQVPIEEVLEIIFEAITMYAEKRINNASAVKTNIENHIAGSLQRLTQSAGNVTPNILADETSNTQPTATLASVSQAINETGANTNLDRMSQIAVGEQLTTIFSAVPVLTQNSFWQLTKETLTYLREDSVYEEEYSIVELTPPFIKDLQDYLWRRNIYLPEENTSIYFELLEELGLLSRRASSASEFKLLNSLNIESLDSIGGRASALREFLFRIYSRGVDEDLPEQIFLFEVSRNNYTYNSNNIDFEIKEAIAALYFIYNSIDIEVFIFNYLSSLNRTVERNIIATTNSGEPGMTRRERHRLQSHQWRPTDETLPSPSAPSVQPVFDNTILEQQYQPVNDGFRYN